MKDKIHGIIYVTTAPTNVQVDLRPSHTCTSPRLGLSGLILCRCGGTLGEDGWVESDQARHVTFLGCEYLGSEVHRQFAF